MKTVFKYRIKITHILICFGFFMMIFGVSSVRALSPLGWTDAWGFAGTKTDKFMENIKKANIDSEDIIVAVIDSGVDASDISLKGENGKSRVKFALDCNKDKCFVPDQITDDVPGYMGTNAASAVAHGTLDNVKIMSIKLLEDYDDAGNSMVYNTALQNAFRNILLLKYAGTLNIKVINVSYKIMLDENLASNDQSLLKCDFDNGLSYSTYITFASSLGISTVISAGDYEESVSNCIAETTNAITVGSMNRDFERVYGSGVDFISPGVDVFGNYNGIRHSTGVAASYVSAQIALLYTACPTCSPETIEKILHNSAVDLGEKGYDKYYDHGYIDMEKAWKYMDKKLTPETIEIETKGPGKMIVSNGMEYKSNWIFTTRETVTVTVGTTITFKPIFAFGIRFLKYIDVDKNNPYVSNEKYIVKNLSFSEFIYKVPRFSENAKVTLYVQYSLFGFDWRWR